MAILNLSIEEHLLQRASAIATAQGTTLSVLLNSYIRHYINNQISYQQATQRILELAKQANAASSSVRWTRESLYER